MLKPIMPVYNPAPIAPVRGEGVWLFEQNGAAWLDCIGGVASNALGHCHRVLVQALSAQAEKLWHVSNLLQVPGQAALAERLISTTFADTAFFCNTGTEAVECAIKTARRFHNRNGAPERVDIVGFSGSFHGRTYAAINASGNAAYLDGFGPAMAGFKHVDLDNAEDVRAAILAPTTAAVIVEPVQGEGGARALREDDLRRLRELTTGAGVLLIYDEVQSGMGRTGRLFAHQWFEGVEPDIMAIAKALGSGFPVGACLSTAVAASGMSTGAHGSTFGGNPLAMAVASAAFDFIANPETLAHVRLVAARLRDGLAALASRYPDIILELRGKGLLIGARLRSENRAFMAAARDQRLLIAGGGDNCIRLLPPLTITTDEADEVLARLEATCAAMATRISDAA